MKFAADGPMAIPFWINGRAYLTVTESFVDVCDPLTGEAVRRTPLAGSGEVAEAIGAALAAQASWGALDAAERQATLAKLAGLLDQYAGHFLRLIRQETGWDEGRAQTELTLALSALQGTEQAHGDGVLGVITDASSPLAAGMAALARILRSGGAVVWKPSPKLPGAAFALAELSGRAGVPAGVLNLVHGDVAVMEALCADPAIRSVEVGGEEAFVAKVLELAERQGREIRVFSPT